MCAKMKHDSEEKKNEEVKAFVKSVCNRLENARKLKGISEKELGVAIERKQPSVSRLIKSGEGLNLHMLFKICKVLDLDVAEVFEEKPKKSEKLNVIGTENTKKKDEEPIITDASSVRFDGYLGDYKGYFFSTVSSEEILHNGDFKIYKQRATNKCIAKFTFDTMEIDEKTGKHIMKTYKGPVKLSQRLGAISCELTAQGKSGDVSYIIFEHKDKISRKCESALGMAVTICAGGNRHPVAQRFLICRQELSDDDLLYIKGQLKLNEKRILISEQDYKAFIADKNLPESFDCFDKQGNDLLKASAKTQEYYQFSEADIASVTSLSGADLAKTISLLREYSYSRPSTKVGKECGDYIFDYLKEKKKREHNKES